MHHFIRVWLYKDPRYAPLKDDSLHIYEREVQVYKNFLPEKQAKLQKLREKYGEDYIMLRPATKLYVRHRILSRDMKYSTLGQLGLSFKSFTWLAKLRCSKFIQDVKYNSYSKYRMLQYLKYLGKR